MSIHYTAAPYSFVSVYASITGPNGSFSLSNGNADGGISIAKTGAKNTKTVGADGSVQHSMHADESGIITVRLLKVSPTNGMLQAMYDADRADPTLWGQNMITLIDTARGETITANYCAFQKFPDTVYDKEGPALNWVFDVANFTTILA